MRTVTKIGTIIATLYTVSSGALMTETPALL